MTMHINLSPEMESFIKGKVASGFYGNATEVIRDAVRRMQAEENRAQAWRAALQKGDDELDRGEGIPYTAQALNDITDAAIGSLHSAQPMDPDVLPDSPRKVVLSPRARQDFIDILRYTGETWGVEQLPVYRDKINDALQLIARHPAMGRRSPELPETHRLYFVGSHVIVYRDQDATIGVVRILHQRMSPARHL